jgi:hypothetical protein
MPSSTFVEQMFCHHTANLVDSQKTALFPVEFGREQQFGGGVLKLTRNFLPGA